MTETVSQVASYLSDYCERAGNPALFAEPLNAATNLFFILAAVMAGRALWRLQAETKGKYTDIWLQIAALFAIGIGSGIWHLYPTGVTVLMDVIPITIFIHIYLITTLRRVLYLRWPHVILWWGIYLAASIMAQVELSPHLLHGSILYIPTYFTLMILGVVVYGRDRAFGRILLQMLGLWTVSLICRTVDLDVCEQFHWGTHFLWHTLNAVMLYRLVMAYIRRPVPTIH